MATNNQLKFYKKASQPSGAAKGSIWFNTTDLTIEVFNGTTWEKFAGKLQTADWNASTQKLTIKKYDGSQIDLDFSGIASLEGVVKAINDAKAALIGSETDAASVNTIYGAKKAAAEANTAASNAQAHSEGVAGNLATEIENRGKEITRVEGLITAEAATARAAEQANAKAASDADAKAAAAQTYAEGVNTALGKEVERATAKESELAGKISALETAVGEGGSVEAQVIAKIEGLDADVTSTNGAHVNVQVVETDGKVTAVNVTEDFSDINESLGALGQRITTEAPVTISTDEFETGTILKSYTFTQNGKSIGTINIARDLVVNGGDIVEQEGVKYLKLNILNQPEDKPVMIPVTDLVDVYTGDEFVTISNKNVISVDKAGIIDGLATDANAQGYASAAQSAAQAYADGLAKNYATAAQGGKADTAIQNGVSGTYVSLTKDGTNLKVAETIQAVSTASASAKGLAEASDVKAYVDAQVSGKNVDAQGDEYVTATAAGNKVTVAASAKTQASLALADTAVQKVETGTSNGTIKVDGAEVAVFGLKSAAFAETTAFDAAGAAATAEANAKAYADGLMMWVEFE